MGVAVEQYTVERCAAIDPLAAEWDELAVRVGSPPFARPGWIGAWWRAFGAGTLEVVVLRRDGRLAGVLPLVARAGGLQTPANWHTPEFACVAESDDARRALYAEALAAARTFAFLRFVDGEADAALGAAEAAGFSSLVRTLEDSPYVPLGGEVPRPGAKALAKTREKLGREGELALDVRSGGEDLDAVLREAFELEGSGWKIAEGTAIVSQPETLRFYTEIARWAADVGLLRICFLRVGGRAIAAHVGMADGHAYYFLKGGYDPEYRKHGPGKVIVDLIIEWAQEQGLETFEFLGAQEPWKAEWTELKRARRAVEAFPPGAAGGAARLAYTRVRPLAKRGLSLAARLRGGGPS